MKVKTKQAAYKRFKMTKTGKIIRGHQLSRHLRQTKSKARQRRQSEPAVILGKFAQKIRQMIPYR